MRSTSICWLSFPWRKCGRPSSGRSAHLRQQLVRRQSPRGNAPGLPSGHRRPGLAAARHAAWRRCRARTRAAARTHPARPDRCGLCPCRSGGFPGGTDRFVALMVPHFARMLVGPALRLDDFVHCGNRRHFRIGCRYDRTAFHARGASCRCPHRCFWGAVFPFPSLSLEYQDVI